MQNVFFEKPKGNATVILIMLIGVLACMQGALMDWSWQSQDALGKFRYVNIRDTIVSKIKTNSLLGSSFRNSISSNLPVGTNQALQNCILGTAAVPCQGQIEQAFTLYSPISNSPAGEVFQAVAGAGPATSNNATPVFYDAKGNFCQPGAGVTCTFATYSTFIATCSGGAATCASAQTIQIHYVVRSLVSPTTKSSLQSLATVDQLTDPMNVSDILPPLLGTEVNTSTTTLTLLNGTSSTTTAPIQFHNFTLSQNQPMDMGGGLSLTLENNGVLALTNVAGTTLWATTPTASCVNGCEARFQGDGNFVISNGGSAIWASGSYGNPGATLNVNPNGPVYMQIVSADSYLQWDTTRSTNWTPPSAASIANFQAWQAQNPGAVNNNKSTDTKVTTHTTTVAASSPSTPTQLGLVNGCTESSCRRPVF